QVVRFEDMCREPRATLGAVLAHCRLQAADSWLDERAAAIRFPAYYRARFDQNELEVIERHTAATAARFGYSGTSTT
ncbi:MAG: sulfotransferase, partial [Geminicoccaceae bacterium]